MNTLIKLVFLCLIESPIGHKTQDRFHLLFIQSKSYQFTFLFWELDHTLKRRFKFNMFFLKFFRAVGKEESRRRRLIYYLRRLRSSYYKKTLKFF